jgi:hypothetical protein
MLTALLKSSFPDLPYGIKYRMSSEPVSTDASACLVFDRMPFVGRHFKAFASFVLFTL